jgi:hypothetical protein
MGGDDQRLIADAKGLKRLGGAAHDRPIGLAAHDDGDRLRRPVHKRPPSRESTRFMGLRLKEGGKGRKRTRAIELRSKPVDTRSFSVLDVLDNVDGRTRLIVKSLGAPRSFGDDFLPC